MGYLSLLKIHYTSNQNIFISLEFSYFTIFDQKLCFKIFWKGKNFKISTGIRIDDLQIRSKTSNPTALRC